MTAAILAALIVALCESIAHHRLPHYGEHHA